MVVQYILEYLFLESEGGNSNDFGYPNQGLGLQEKVARIGRLNGPVCIRS